MESLSPEKTPYIKLQQEQQQEQQHQHQKTTAPVEVSSLESQEDNATASDVKLQEARSAILLRDSNKYTTRSETTMWILEHMFRPLTMRDYDEYQLLLLSTSVKPAWERKKKDVAKQRQDGYFAHNSSQVISPASNTNEGTPTTPTVSMALQAAIPSSEKMYIITPRTRILTVSKEHNIVFMIDLSSSLATIETSTGKVMLGSAFSILENIIQGLVRPFSIYTSDTSPPIAMECTVRITVIAECSQFGSNMNVIPILAEYPTMRVLMQNVQVSVNNVSAVLKTLKDMIDTFKKDLAKFRRRFTLKRSKLGYELDVRGDHSQSVAESVESKYKLQAPLDSPTSMTVSRKGSTSSIARSGHGQQQQQNHQQARRHSRTRSMSVKQSSGKKNDSTGSGSTSNNKKSGNSSHHHHHSHHHRNSSINITQETEPTRRSDTKDKNEVWGVGKTGSSLSYILRTGLLALKLLPRRGQHSIILLTDGVVKSNVQDESIIRQLAAEDIACNIVQLGQEKGFFPGLNFGFVPDNEILEFVASATNGSFAFGEQCPALFTEENNSSPDAVFFATPNIYHQRYMLKEVYLDYISSYRLLRKNKEATRKKEAIDSEPSSLASSTDASTTVTSVGAATSGMTPHFGRRAFPWDPMSIPVSEDLGKLKFKEYFLPTECWHFMRARLRDGFMLQSVSFIDEPKPASGTGSNSNKSSNGLPKQSSLNGLPSFQRKQNVVIVLVLRWQPNIIVQYSIKALWTSSLRYHLKSMSLNQEKLLMHIPEEPFRMQDSDNIFSCMRAPKVEIVIKSTSTFSHMLHNWEQFQRRNQMMAVQGGNATVDLSHAPGFIKVGKMKRLLERIADTDNMLKQLVQFNITEKNQQLGNSILSHYQSFYQHQSPDIDHQSQINYIQKFSSHWAKLERSELRVFNGCWYDEHQFNIIIGGKATNFLGGSSMIDPYDTGEEDFDMVQIALNGIYEKLQAWSTFMSEDQQVYIKLLSVNETLKASKSSSDSSTRRSPNSSSAQSSSNKKHVVPKFCELRIVRETRNAMFVKLLFFNCDIKLRYHVTDKLKELLQTDQQLVDTLAISNTQNTYNTPLNSNLQSEYNGLTNAIVITHRPLSNLLIRDSSHFLAATSSNNLFDPSKTGSQDSNHLWYINPGMLLTGEYLVRNYLRQYTWHWDTHAVIENIQNHHRYFAPISELAFQHILAARSEQMWITVASGKSFAHLYKEVCYGRDAEQRYSAQYFIWKDIQKKRISTELWVEPLFDLNQKLHDAIKTEIFEQDKSILSQLTTFDVIHLFAQNTLVTIANVLTDHMEVEYETRGVTRWMQRASLFSMSSALKASSFLFASYPCPNYSRHFHPEGNDSVLTEHQHQEQQEQQHELQQQLQKTQKQDTQESAESTTYLRRRNGALAASNQSSRSRTISRFSPVGSPLSSRTPLSWQGDKSTTCNCPRPDELFCKEKDDISRLQPVLRDIALLHYYVEQLLSAVTDRNMSLQKATADDQFWSSVVKEIMVQQDSDAHQSTLYVAQNFRDLKCFIKTFDPSVFVVILLPRLDAVVKGLCKVDIVPEQAVSFDSMGLVMFECHRQDGSFVNTFDLDQIKVNPIDLCASKEWLESLRSTLRPRLSKGYFSSKPVSDALSDRTLRLMQDVVQVYSRSFVKSIFTCLLHGRAVDSEDFEKVLEICDESSLDIDLTGYLNVQTLLKRRSRTSEEELVSANARFISVLGHYFEPVIISNTKWTNMYCYRPPFAKVGQKLGLSLSSGEKPSNLADVVMCAQNPLFVRLDCTLRRPSQTGIGFDEITFPLRNLPSLYEGELEDGTVYSFEPESIGTKFSPVDSADGTTATLHLVCMTLPQSEYDPPNALFSHKPTCPADSAVHHQTSFLDTDKTHRARLPSLSQDKQDALVETEARLTWLFTEEIMHGLLRSGPITQNVIRYIEAQLKKKNPFVDFPTTMFIPLAFVKNQRDSRRMFFEQLEKHNKTPYRLVRVGDCFYASDNGTNTSTVLQSSLIRNQEKQKRNNDNGSSDSDDRDSLFDGGGLNITTNSRYNPERDSSCNSSVSIDEEEEQQSDEFCEGLGISIQEPETPDNEQDSSAVESVKPQLYWLLLIPQAHSVQIYFYSKMQQSVNRSEIIRVTKHMVSEVIERTNKMSLLRSLHDTRRCSKYLLASVEEDKAMYSSCEDSSEEDEHPPSGARNGSKNNLVEILSTSGEETTFSPPKKFLPGQFSCDLVYSKQFPLHWRLAPNSAYNKLMTDTLPPFLVQNKPGMFVCSHEGAVVYCFLSEVTTSIHSTTLSDSMNQSFLSANNAENEHYASNPESPYGFSSMIHANEPDILGASRNRYTSHTQTNKPSPQGSVTSDRQQFSPRQSPSLTDAGATSPMIGRRPGTRQYEGRELLLEVYGVEVDYYIVDGLVEMINSRITSEITLKEVQQFLVRNPNSKLSRADIEFILPIDKEPLLHRQLSIPNMIENTVHFLRIFRKNLLTGSSLHVLHSNYLPGVMRRHHELRYCSYDFNSSRVLDECFSRSLSADDWSCLDFSFYYNYLNRAPGTHLPFEQKIGEGVAGICLSVLNDEDMAYTKITSNQPGTSEEVDVDLLQSCLLSDFEQTSHDEKLKISIDVWSHCKLNVDQIYQYIYASFRQSVCDYIIESTAYCIPNVRTNKQEFKSVANLLMSAMKKAAEWESATVKQIIQPVKLAPWYLNSISLQLRSDLLDIHSTLDPIVAKAVLSSEIDAKPQQSEEYILCDLIATTKESNHNFITKLSSKRSSLVENLSIQDHHRQLSPGAFNPAIRQQSNIPLPDNKNSRYLLISGIPDLQNNCKPASSLNIRRTSTETNMAESVNSNRIHSRSSYLATTSIGEDDHIALRTDLFSKRDDSISLHSRQESLASSISKTLPASYPSKQKIADTSHQHNFVVFTIDSFQLCMYAYNCSDQFIESVFSATSKNVVQQEIRHSGLNNILHQKLGLFHHSDTMGRIVSRNYELEHPVATPPPSVVPATPLQHNAVTQIQIANGGNSNGLRSPMSPSLASTIGRLVQMDSSSSVPSIESLGNERKSISNKPASCVVDFENLQQLITNNYEYKSKHFRSYQTPTTIMEKPRYTHNSVLEIYDNAKLCKSSLFGTESGVFTAVRGADANTVLRDVYAESTEDNQNWYDKDYLLRHGEPYLEMYLARSKPLAAHEKAFKVYTKWADQYYGPGHTKTTDEMMTVDELKQILKASRLLHFCRTPLIFSGSNSPSSVELPSSITDGSSSTNTGFEKLFNKPTVSKSEEMTAWYERLSRAFMREYASYLESIGMHLIVYGPTNDQRDEIEAYLSSFTITEDYSVSSPVVYLLQVFEGGSIMCQVRLTGAFVSVTLYTLHRRYGRLQFSPYSRQQREEIGRENFQKFMGECDEFKQRIHVNSFVFDFHLRYIQRSLDDVELLPPNLNLLSIIKNTVSVYDCPAIYARNRIMHGIYEVSVDDSLAGLTHWLLNAGPKLGLKTLKVDNTAVACFVSSDDLSFNGNNNESSEDALFRYTLIICPAEKTIHTRWKDSISVHRQGSFDMMGSSSMHKIVNHVVAEGSQNKAFDRKINLQYFILATYRGMDRCTSTDKCQRAWSRVLKDKPKRYANYLDEVLLPGTLTMNEVFESAKKQMDYLVNKSVRLFNRELDWSKLYQIVRPNLSKESPEDLIHLAFKFSPIDLGKVDISFNKFLKLKGINWDDALDNLKIFYMITSGDVQAKDTRHVLLFIPNATTPGFFHFIHVPGEPCRVTINTKEDRKQPNCLTEDEKRHVGNLANSLSYYLWKRVQ